MFPACCSGRLGVRWPSGESNTLPWQSFVPPAPAPRSATPDVAMFLQLWWTMSVRHPWYRPAGAVSNGQVWPHCPAVDAAEVTMMWSATRPRQLQSRGAHGAHRVLACGCSWPESNLEVAQQGTQWWNPLGILMFLKGLRLGTVGASGPAPRAVYRQCRWPASAVGGVQRAEGWAASCREERPGVYHGVGLSDDWGVELVPLVVVQPEALLDWRLEHDGAPTGLGRPSGLVQETRLPQSRTAFEPRPWRWCSSEVAVVMVWWCRVERCCPRSVPRPSGG